VAPTAAGAVDWGIERQPEFNGYSLGPESQAFALTAANSGLLTIEATVVPGPHQGPLHLELVYDSTTAVMFDRFRRIRIQSARPAIRMARLSAVDFVLETSVEWKAVTT
jgi:hypothetical protein